MITETFKNRVNRAASHISRGTPSTRHFDNCFEMYDGAYVVAALARRIRAKPDGTLALNITKYLTPESIHDRYQEFAHLSNDELISEAARIAGIEIAKTEAQYREWGLIK